MYVICLLSFVTVLYNKQSLITFVFYLLEDLNLNFALNIIYDKKLTGIFNNSDS